MKILITLSINNNIIEKSINGELVEDEEEPGGFYVVFSKNELIGLFRKDDYLYIDNVQINLNNVREFY